MSRTPLAAEGWRSGRVDSFCTVVDCKHVTAPFGAEGYPVVSIGEVGERLVNLRHAPRTTTEFYALLIQGARKPLPGDLIMTRNATVGRVSRVAESHPPFAMGQDVCLLRPNATVALPEFIQVALRSPDVVRQFEAAMAGSTFKRLNVAQIKQVRIELPPIDEQARIAEALSVSGDLISALERLIVKKQAIKQGMMQQLLTGNTRLTRDRSAWTGKPLSELCDIRSGAPKRKDSAGAHWIVDMGSVTRDAKLIVTKRTDDLSGRLTPGELVMPKDDIGGGQIIGRTGLIPDTGIYVLADHVYALTPKGVHPAFLNLAINSNPVNMELRSKVTGSAQLGLSRRSVLEQCIMLPNSLEEQAAIATVFKDVNSETEVIEGRLRKMRAIKQGMMQELLTGRTRLKLAVETA